MPCHRSDTLRPRPLALQVSDPDPEKSLGMLRSRAWISALVLLGVAAALLPLSSSAKQVESFSLRPGRSVFWNGGPEDTRAPCGGVSCWTYRLDVAPNGD